MSRLGALGRPSRDRWLAVGLVVALAALAFLAVEGARRWRASRPRVYLEEAERRLAASDPAGALGWLDLPERTAATRDRALILRARAALGRKRPAEAVAPLGRVDRRGPLAVEADFWKGRTLYEAGQARGAVAWFRAVHARRPDDPEALRWLAAASYDLGDWRSAVSALEAVTRLRPRDARAWRTLGTLFKEEVELERAALAFEASLAADEGQPEVLLELAEVRVRQGRYRDAEARLRACRGNVRESRRLDLAARCLIGLGAREEARTLLDAALERFPEDPGLLAQRASIAQVDGEAGRAARWLDRAVAAEPTNPEWLYQRGRVARSLGRVAESDRDLERAAALTRQMAEMSRLATLASGAPDDPAIRCQLGDLCVRLGKADLAAYWYRAALACDPASRAARAGLGRLGGR